MNLDHIIFRPGDTILHIPTMIKHTVDHVIVRGYDLMIHTTDGSILNSKDVKK